MELKIEISDYEAKTIFERILDEQLEKIIEPRIVEKLKNKVNSSAIAEILEKKIKDIFRCGDYGRQDGPLYEMLDKKLSEVVNNITDEELKNAILNRLITKI